MTMLHDSIRPDQDVVDVNMTETTDVLAKNPIHEPLERGDGIAETLGHNNPLEQTKGSFKCCLVDIRLFHETLIICHRKIHLSENLAKSSCVNDVVLASKRSMIFDSIIIESTIIMNDPRRRIGILL